MAKTVFVDFSCNIFDKHHVYSLCSYLKSRGIDVDYVNEKTFDRTVRRISHLRPDLLLYSAFSTDAEIYFEFDRAVKRHADIKSIMGGPGPTFDFSYAEKSTIDAFCVGEGEFALHEYIESGFTSGKNIILRGHKTPSGLHPFIDLDSIPIPDRTVVYEKDPVLRLMTTKQFMSSRGCPYHCTYCHNHAFNKMFKGSGKVVRRKSVDYMIEEILFTRSKYPLKNILFHDDNFLTDRKWFYEFSERFPREVGIKYAILARANDINETTAQALKESGCIFISWSIECANDNLRDAVLKRRMSREQILNAGYLMSKYGIPQKIGNMLGVPGETFEDMLETLKLNIEIRPQISLATIFTPYPGLELTDYALRNGYLSEEALNNLPDYFSETVLNYPPIIKARVSRLSKLFPIIVDFPFLFRNKAIFDLVLKFPIPKSILSFLYEIHYLIKYSRQFKVRTPFSVSLRILMRHISEKLGLNRPAKNF